MGDGSYDYLFQPLVARREEHPSDFGLPFDEWRPGQKEMVTKALCTPPGRLLVIEAPTGLGKSAITGAAANCGGAIGMVATRELQQQYANSFPNLTIVWGQEHYACVLESRVKQWRSEYGVEPTRADCPYSPASDCPAFLSCPYERAKRVAHDSSRLVMNYAYAYWTNWWRDLQAPLFLDEAHSIPQALSSLSEVSIPLATVQRYRLPPLPLVGGSSRLAFSEALSWVHKAKGVLQAYVKSETDERNALRAKRLLASLEHLEEQLSTAAPETWHIESGMGLGRFSAKPAVLHEEAFRRIAPAHLPCTLMSATIGNAEVLLTELGLHGVDFDFCSFPHVFPESNRPVFFYTNSPCLSKRATEKEYRAQADIIVRILRTHAGQRGIIHTYSWQHARLLASMLSKEFPERVYLPTGDRVQAVAEFLARGTDTVAISPSWSQGLDLRDDFARFSIIAKIPFPYLGDPVVELKLRHLGRKWYDWQAALHIVQAAGRIVRHENDWGITYIVDGHWPRVARMAPAWFKVTAV